MSSREHRFDRSIEDPRFVRDPEPPKKRLEPGKVAAVDLDPAQLADYDIDVGKVSRAGRQHKRRVDRRAEPGRGTLTAVELDTALSLVDKIRHGERLPRDLEQRLAAELGVDLARVRIHADSHAAEIAKAFGARAITIGDDIYFAANAYDPHSPSGIELIAHEVAHVAQQQKQTPTETHVSKPDEAHEQDADRFASSFVPQAAALGFGNDAGEVVARGDGTGNGSTNAGNDASSAGPTITTTTDQDPPSGAKSDRKRVGVGEKVVFDADSAGAWSATNARGPKTGTGTSYTWLAPVTHDSVVVTFTPKGGAPKTTTMEVIEPSDVELKWSKDVSMAANTQGAGMELTVRFLPLDVSFAFTAWHEVPGPASGQTGYFTKNTAPAHHPNRVPRHMGADNGGPTDTAAFSGFPKPWTDGFFEWVIPTHYVVDGEQPPGHKIKDIHQTAKIEGDPHAGRMTVTKGTHGATVTRDVDGTVAPQVAVTSDGAAGFGTGNPEPLTGTELYLSVQQNDVWRAVTAHLARVPWPTPHDHFSWKDEPKFLSRMMLSLQHTVDLDKHPQLDEVLYPVKAIGVIEPLVKGAGRHWVEAAGRAIGELFEDAILASLARLVPRWVSLAEHEPDPDAVLDETKPLVKYDSLVKSAPIDRAVAMGLVAEGVCELVGATTQDYLDKTKPRHLRKLKKDEYEWQGEHDRGLWNWIRVKVPDITAEDVAATLYEHAEGKYGEATSFFAYGITAVPPMFGIPASWARSLPGAKDYAPLTATPDDSQGARYLALAQSKTGDELALSQQAAETAKDATDAKATTKSPKAAELLGTIHDMTLQAQYLIDTLTPWKHVDGPLALANWLESKSKDVATMKPEDLGHWAPIFEGQKARLKRVGTGVGQVVASATTFGISSPEAPTAGPLVELLDTYARAAGVSHMHDTCEELLGKAARQQASLAVRGVRGTANAMIATVDGSKDILYDADRKRLVGDAQTVADQARVIQDKLAVGAEVDEGEVDEVTLHSREISFETRAAAMVTQASRLQAAAEKAGSGLASHIAAHFHGSFKDLQSALTTIKNEVGYIWAVWDDGIKSFDQNDNDPTDRDKRRREFRHERLDTAEKQFDEFRGHKEIIDFLKEGADIIKWQEFAKACVEMLALVAISIVSAGIGSAVAEGVGGLMMATAEGAEAATELSMGARFVSGAAKIVTESAVNTVGQVEVQGGNYGEAFLENLLVSVGSETLIARIGKDLSFAKQIEEKTASTWVKVGRAGKTVLKAGVSISLHTISGAALGYVAHMIVTRKAGPGIQSMDLRDWFMQGASVALGRYGHGLVEGRRPLHQKLELINELHAGDLGHYDEQLSTVSQRAQDAPKPEDATEIVEKAHQVLDREQKALETLEGDPVLMERSKMTLAEVHAAEAQNRNDRVVEGTGLEDVAVTGAGLEELMPGNYKGTKEQIKGLEANAKRMGLPVEATENFDHSWDMKVGSKKLKVHMVEGGKPIAESELEVHEQTKEHEPSKEPPKEPPPVGFGKDPHAVDAHQVWLDELRSKLTNEEKKRLERITRNKSAEQIHEMLGDDLEVAVAHIREWNLPAKYVKIRGALGEQARRAFDKKWRAIVGGQRDPSAKRIEMFQNYLDRTEKLGGGDLDKGLAAEAASIPVDAVVQEPKEDVPKEWHTFDEAGNADFKRKLEEFRGSEDMTSNGAGAEGRVFVGPDRTKALKRWFASQKKNFIPAVDELKKWAATINGNAALAPYVEVVKVYEVGEDWIVRDWVDDSAEIKFAPESESARKAAIEILSKLPGETEQDLMKKLTNKSANVHWDNVNKKMVVIDTQ